MSDSFEVYLLSIRGKLAAKTLDAARALHNDTAGKPQNVAAARSLGDLSHMVYVPLGHNGPEAGDFLILDQWDSLEGLNQFFANPQVQHEAGEIFSERDAVVWKPAEGLLAYHFPAPAGRNDRFVAVVAGKVRSQEEAKRVNNALVSKYHQQSRAGGNLSHETYFRMAAPGSPESLQFLAIDTWYDGAGLQKQFENQEFGQGVMQMFDGQPMIAIWVSPPGSWVEW